ncbi:MAG: AAA family ATPase, partial [Gammaproteobacteria bacterium]
MLTHLHIRNLAVIEELEIGFGPGMSVFTGETGAGKSIIVEALGLVLGDRADNSVIRADADSAEITAIFSVDRDDHDVSTRLEEHGIAPEQEELILRRVINRDGRSRAWANGSPIPIQVLRELGEGMVDIHG